jgi:hypothetical protein
VGDARVSFHLVVWHFWGELGKMRREGSGKGESWGDVEGWCVCVCMYVCVCVWFMACERGMGMGWGWDREASAGGAERGGTGRGLG